MPGCQGFLGCEISCLSKQKKRKLFEILVKEDGYIRVSDITGQFSKSYHGVLPYEVQSAFLSDSGYKPHDKLDCF